LIIAIIKENIEDILQLDLVWVDFEISNCVFNSILRDKINPNPSKTF